MVGISPKHYADAYRLVSLKDLLLRGSSVTDGLYDAGYGSSSRLYEKSTTQIGMTPTTYRKRGAGIRIGYASAECQLGHVLLASTERGIRTISIGDDKQVLEESLFQEFSAAQISPGNDPTLAKWLAEILERLSGKGPNIHLPLDIRATALQRMVWEELQRIPVGETATYGEAARNLRRPGFTRAVARACATNPAAIAIPCHRVVRSDGGLGGYKWG